MTRQKEQEDYRQKNERGERTGESNIIHDSPEIPDRRTTSDIPGFPLGMGWEGGVCVCGGGGGGSGWLTKSVRPFWEGMASVAHIPWQGRG